jgi:hypothetical protein
MATDIARGTATTERSQLERRLNDVGWGLLLMLTGTVWLLPTASVPPGTWLFGVAAILIGINVLRYVKHLAVSGFSLVLGAVALAAAIGEAQRAEPPLVALFLLAIGGSIVFRAAWGRTHGHSA